MLIKDNEHKQSKSSGNKRVFFFKSINVGNLKFRSYLSTNRVWLKPSAIERASERFGKDNYEFRWGKVHKLCMYPNY